MKKKCLDDYLLGGFFLLMGMFFIYVSIMAPAIEGLQNPRAFTRLWSGVIAAIFILSGMKIICLGLGNPVFRKNLKTTHL